MIKAICMDMDGTLLNSNKEISKKTQEGLRKLQDEGIKLILASGRTRKRMQEYAEILEIDQNGGAIIESNGSAIYDYADSQQTEIKRLEHKEAEEIFQVLQQEPIEIMVMGKENTYIRLAPGQSESHYLTSGNMEGLKNREFFYIEEISEIEEPINKVCVLDSPKVISELFENMHIFKGKYWYGRVLPRWLEIGPIEATKGNALRLLAHKHKIEHDEIIVFGDGENDLSMLKLVKYGVAMGNALENVKQASNFVCGNCDEDGIIHFISNMEEQK